MFFIKKLYYKMTYREVYEGTAYYDNELGLIRERENKESDEPIIYCASPAVLSRKNKRALIAAVNGMKKIVSET